jgi:hypothetical protein
MASVNDLSGRRIKFLVGTDVGTPDQQSYEYEIIAGSISDQAAQVNEYVNVGVNVAQVIAHGRTVIFNFTGVLLSDDLPWYDLTPTSPVSSIQITLNRTPLGDDEFETVYHQAGDGVVLSMEHIFSTENHQIFQVSIQASGSYNVPYNTTFVSL